MGTYHFLVAELWEYLDFSRAFRTSESESESAGFQPFGLGLSVFVSLRIYTVKKSTFHKKKINFFSFFKSYHSLYKPHAQISNIVKTL
jgi:hypothetical protein